MFIPTLGVFSMQLYYGVESVDLVSSSEERLRDSRGGERRNEGMDGLFLLSN